MNKNIQNICITTLLLTSASSTSAQTDPQTPLLEEIVVTSEFRDIGLLELAKSASVFDATAIKLRSAKNLDQLINLAPNVNFSSGASRGRFLQIRGIGERSQFIDPVNPSVGLIIDGIDFTGQGLAASTLDIAQVEILRGPQGTLYGANALAGLVTMNSPNTAEAFEGAVSVEIAEYDSRTLSAVVSGPISDTAGYRLALRDQRSDGFIDNDFKRSSNTNNIDEKTAKAKLAFTPNDDVSVDINALYIDADNGYDAFSLFNNRTTLSDEPGHDRQESIAASIKAMWAVSSAFSIESTLSFADSESQYGFDEDWAFVGFHPDGYSSTDNYERERENLSLDVRFVSNPEQGIFNEKSSWVLGVYSRAEDENLLRNNSFASEFKTDNAALYGEIRSQLTTALTLTTGLRLEQRKADYTDNVGIKSDTKETLWGGHTTLEYQADDTTLLYGLISRGYKAGGINGRIISAAQSNAGIGADAFEFETETLINIELGLKGLWLEERLQAQLALFYQDREDVQAKQSIFNPADFSFDDFLTNAAGGETTGIEVDLEYQLTPRILVFASAGYLNAEFADFESTSHVDARDDNNGIVLAPVDLGGRDIAHAPNYQFFLGTRLSLTDSLSVALEVEGKDAFFFSNSHNERSEAYELINVRVAYTVEQWDIALWARNLGDEEVYTRGFYFSNGFGNNPANGYAPEAYYQLGEPRVVGLSASLRF